MELIMDELAKQERVKRMQEGKLKAKQAREQMATAEVVENVVKTVRKEADRVTRETRIPFGSPKMKLGVPYQIPGYHLHWINDSPGRVAQAESGGYEFVMHEEVRLSSRAAGLTASPLGTGVSRLVGKQDDGVTPMYAYLMKIRQEWYEEDQQAGQVRVDATDAAIRGGNVEGHVGKDGRYVPKGGIKFEN